MKKFFFLACFLLPVEAFANVDQINDFLYFPGGNQYINAQGELAEMPFDVGDDNNINLYHVFYGGVATKPEDEVLRGYKTKLFKATFDVLYNQLKLKKAQEAKVDATEYINHAIAREKELGLAKMRYDNTSLAEKDYLEMVIFISPILDIYFQEDKRSAGLQVEEETMSGSICSYYPKTGKLLFNTVYGNISDIKGFYLLGVNPDNSFLSPFSDKFKPGIVVDSKIGLGKIDTSKFLLREIKGYTKKGSELLFDLDKKDLISWVRASSSNVSNGTKTTLKFVLLGVKNNDEVIILSKRNPTLQLGLGDNAEQEEKDAVYSACKMNYNVSSIFHSTPGELQAVRYSKGQELFKKKIDDLFDGLDKKYGFNTYIECMSIPNVPGVCDSRINSVNFTKYAKLLSKLRGQIQAFHTSYVDRYDFGDGDVFSKPLPMLLAHVRQIEKRQDTIMWMDYIDSFITERIDTYLYRYLTRNELKSLKIR